MEKTLIIVTHPKLGSSKINKRWIQELQKYPDKYIIHDLHSTYPTLEIDVIKEQLLLESVNKIVLQFPFYWFNCPPFLKKWIDDVLTHGWAFGKNSGYKLAGKKFALAVTAGIKEDDYRASGQYEYTLEELTRPFETTFKYVNADYRPLYAFYGEEHNPTQEDIEANAKNYINFIENL
ncbi:flavodoxin family protein [Aquimarina sp. AD10]|uniref:NAD(P)H-dependent oxidoreductase n=1 Tax=Aquimarina TaxID=290174 RepID=UPI000E4D3009|nr:MULTISPECIES: NAD(P)H-dependent oxidoreductase [Aquimarina]AXT62664.1 flavodoxin family protein [Aquimarina sp. AD10]RKM98396.1 flavodoxin family protein [Aquimarina sp. AD10]